MVHEEPDAISTDFTVNQTFLILTLIYVLLPTLMVVLTLLLEARVNRIVNIVVSLLYMISVLVSCIGETWPTTSWESSSRRCSLPPSPDLPGDGRHRRSSRR